MNPLPEDTSLQPPWIYPRITETVRGYYRDARGHLRTVQVLYARGQWVTIHDKAIEIIGWK